MRAQSIRISGAPPLKLPGGFAIASDYKSFEVNCLLRRTALYFVLALAIAATYALIIAAVSQLAPSGDVVTSLALQIPAFVLLVFLFQPLRNALQSMIAATFLRSQVDDRPPSYGSLQEIAVSLEDRIREQARELEKSNAELGHTYQELRSAQRQLLQSEKMASLGQLVAGIAHEINNPVSFIVGNMQPLREKLTTLEAAARRHQDPDLVRSVERLGRIFDTIGRGAERTAGIVQDLRTFSRTGDAARAPFDVHEGLEVSLRLLRSKWQPRITIERDYGDLPLIEAAPGQINQVLMNLLSNACDAIDKHGTIRIATRREDGKVRLTIADDGAGISEEALSRIFDPFFTTKAQGQGTGLGLSITHGIVEDHDGKIEVDSEGGQGTMFTVWLPIRAASEPASI